MKKAVKVPVILQQEAVECGAASLAMVLAYHGKWLPLEQVREDCGVSRDGSSAKSIVQAARRYGMKAAGYRLEPSDLSGVPLPCILHWNFNHFVVFCGFRGHGALICNPATGPETIPMEEFDRAFTGVALVFEPQPAFVREGHSPSLYRFIRSRLRGSGSMLAFVLMISLLTSVLGIISPLFSRVFLDDLLTGAKPQWLMPFVYLFAAFILLQTVVSVLSANYNLKISGKFAIIGSGTFLWHVLQLPIQFFSARFAGDIAMRQQANEGIASTVFERLAPLALDMAMLVFYLVVMLSYSIPLTLIGLGGAALTLLVSAYVARKRANISRASMMLMGKLQATTLSGVEMIETIKSSGAEDGFFQKWSGYHAGVNAAAVQSARLGGYWGSLAVLCGALSGVFVLCVGAALIMKGALTVGMLLAFQGFLTAFMGPVETLRSLREEMERLRANMERVQDVMNYSPDLYPAASPDDETRTYRKLSGNVTLSHVTFGYNPLAAPLIEDFSMSLKTGQRVALVGASGCGKSTLAKLISGLYRPWSGEILFDGKPIDQIEHEVFTGSVAVVDQDVTLFEDTVAANIKMWDESIADFEMILAAHDAQIDHMILSREGGYRAKLLEGGKNYSGGERQRIDIARALALDPTIAILDEATSALDAQTEAELIRAICNRGITCVIIAHRLSTIRDCDEIIVLDHGKVAQRGKHEALYASEGLYRELVTMN
ncbi:MAG TPA: NHLP family bacteriocin export ABC transporter peptidase/permease/ATPase subunit [Candidatus Limiplasma sp.]|nr:NHLP family bacteriocin export ABC transporter peptidase/permease/ATPase subunit [Candidatus Limiplasma sp.]HPS80300.1 NHLP family bacteriocin export ABC transporter peptidase/permease/ATPase subunit [Candidatus Limiplasma sp.]